MADNKQYVTQVQENGTVLISEDVITTIVMHAVEEVEGVVCLSAKPGATDFSAHCHGKNMGGIVAAGHHHCLDTHFHSESIPV